MTSPLASLPLFAGLEPDALALLDAKLRPQPFASGEVIVREGEPGNRLFLIHRGSVRIIKHYASPEPVTLATLPERDFFGEMCLLETLPRAASVLGASDGELLSLSSVAFYELYKAKPEQYCILILNLARDLSRRLRRLDEAFASRP